MVPRLLIRSHTALREPDLSGGADRLMITLASALSDAGWQVEVLCPSPRTEPTDGDYQIHYNEFKYHTPRSAPAKMVNTVRGARTFYDLTRRKDFDIILDDVSHLPFYPAHFLRPRRTVNALFIHLMYFELARQFMGIVNGSVIDLIDRTLPYLTRPEIVCAGPSTEARLRDSLRYDKTQVLRPCVRTDEFEYSLDPNSKQILYLGRLTRRKNPTCLIDAWSEIEAHNDDYRLVIAGAGEQERSLKRRAKQLGLSRVEFKGYVSEAEKNRLFSQSLLYVLPSRLEGYATTGLEALAAGTPIVGSDVPGINDYVVDGETGFLFRNDDPEHLAEVIENLLDDPSRLVSVAEQGRQLAERHSYESFSNDADTVFSKLLTRADDCERRP